MQVATKRFVPVAITAVLAAASLMPGIVSAEATPHMVPATEIAHSEFCTNLQNRANEQNGKLTSLESKLSDAQSKHASTLHGDWGADSTKLSGLQSQWQTDRNNEYTKLMSLTKTDAEKQAVTTFESTVNTAISTRESANAAARTAYQNSVMAAANTEADSVNAAVTVLKNAISSAVATAEADCQSGSSSTSSIETTLQSSVNSAKQTYQTAVEGARSTYKSTVASLRNTEIAAINKNNQTFQSTLQSATSTLKAAFGVSS